MLITDINILPTHDTHTLVLTVDKGQDISFIDELKKHTEKGKLLDCELKKHRQKRSLDANAYMWVLLQKLAEKLNTSKDELYLLMLERYGQFTHVLVSPAAVDRVKEQWRLIRELGVITVRGTKGIQLQCFFGSSTYNSSEMCHLIEGVVSECKEQGIETLTPAEVDRLVQEWGE